MVCAPHPSSNVLLFTVHCDYCYLNKFLQEWWNKQLVLTAADNECLVGGVKLLDKHMDVVQKLMQEQFPDLQGLRTTWWILSGR